MKYKAMQRLRFKDKEVTKDDIVELSEEVGKLYEKIGWVTKLLRETENLPKSKNMSEKKTKNKNKGE